MKKVLTLQFPTVSALWLFKGEVQPNFFEMNATLRTITCECSEEEIEKAITMYKAVIYSHGDEGTDAPPNLMMKEKGGK